MKFSFSYLTHFPCKSVQLHILGSLKNYVSVLACGMAFLHSEYAAIPWFHKDKDDMVDLGYSLDIRNTRQNVCLTYS